jgi:hypothetical protein
MSDIPQEHTFSMQYYPTDFFYSTNAQDMPQGFEGCTILNEKDKDSNVVCNAISSDPNISSGEIYKCYQGELCKNKKMVDHMYKIRTDHYIASQQYENIENKYRFESFKMANLIIGTIVAIVFIHYNKQSA